MLSEYYFLEGQHVPHPTAVHRGLNNVTLLGHASISFVSPKAGFSRIGGSSLHTPESI